MKHQPFFDLLTEIIEGICAHKNDLRIYDEGGKLTVLPHTADYPKLVGGRGRQVRAFTHVVEHFAAKHGLPLGYSLRESFVGTRDPDMAFRFNPDFDEHKGNELAFKLARSLLGEQCNVISGSAGSTWLMTIQSPTNLPLVDAIEGIFYAYAKANGRVLQLKHEPTETNVPKKLHQ